MKLWGVSSKFAWYTDTDTDTACIRQGSGQLYQYQARIWPAVSVSGKDLASCISITLWPGELYQADTRIMYQNISFGERGMRVYPWYEISAEIEALRFD